MAKKKGETCACGSENFVMQTIVQIVGMDDQGPIPGPNSEMRLVCAACGAGMGDLRPMVLVDEEPTDPPPTTAKGGGGKTT